MKKMLASLVAIALFASSLALAVPVLHFSSDAKLNLMMKNEIVQVDTHPMLKLIFQHVNHSKMTMIYQGSDAKGIYEFYDQALGKQGWKDAPAMGHNGEVREGDYQGTYAFEEYTLSFMAKVEMGRVRVTISVK